MNRLSNVAFCVAVMTLVLPHPARAQRNLLVSSDFNDSVQRYSETGEYLGAFVPTGFGGLDSPQGIAVGPDGNVYVSSAPNDQILKYRGSDGAFLGAFVDNDGMLDQPWYLTFGPDNNLYVSSSLTSKVLCYDGQTGEFLRIAAQSSALFRPDGISFLPGGQMLVSNFVGGPARILRFDPESGTPLGTIVSDPALASVLEHRISADGTSLFLSAFGNNSIRKYSLLTGSYLGEFSTQNISGPVGQLVAADGSVLVSNWLASSIDRYDGVTGAFISNFTAGGALSSPNNMVWITVPEPAAGAIFIFGAIASLRRKG